MATQGMENKLPNFLSLSLRATVLKKRRKDMRRDSEEPLLKTGTQSIFF
jgi:hypothetical protein